MNVGGATYIAAMVPNVFIHAEASAAPCIRLFIAQLKQSPALIHVVINE